MFVKLTEVVTKSDNLTVPHKGLVVDNNDPRKLGRVKCIIENYFETDNYVKLPWIHPRLSSSSPSSTSLTPPEIGTELWVEFPFKNPYHGIYKGYWYDENNGIANENNLSNILFGEDYPNTYGFQDSTGNYLKVNKLKETFDIEHSSGDHLHVDKNGNTLITGVKNIVINNAENIEIINKKNLKVTNTGLIEITSLNSNINIKSNTGGINITALSKCTINGTAGVTVTGGLIKFGSEALIPKINGVVTGTTPCLVLGIGHALGSNTVLSV